MSIDTLTATRATPRNWETPVPNGVAENEMPDTGEVEMSFWDFVDIVNPLQHIPVVNTVYRELTGDTIKGVSRVIGGGLYGGIVGLVAGVGSAIIAETTGKDPGEHLMAMVTGSGDGEPAAEAPQVASAETPRPSAPPPGEPAPATAAAPPATPAVPAIPPAMAEAAPAGEILIPAAVMPNPVPASRRPGESDSKFFAVPKRVEGLQPKSTPPIATGPGANLEKMPAHRASAQLAAAQAAEKPAAAPATPAPSQTSSWPPGGSAQIPPELVADMMMNALDKYRQGARTGTAAAPAGNSPGAARGSY
ncbi:hypothetical protein IGS68_27430 [Skermanella sp. TT6]|uniref:Uncharacterized protein n=1 Tax=Skermanella cutis TaxID=2775420 RepID=A0ABX7B661_9PROT|nr:hypothetical protein [Skermanella sp. TT6]QQP89652.1 hypothetical protein IGS68_27430 [Skermanella sp. TT6]